MACAYPDGNRGWQLYLPVLRSAGRRVGSAKDLLPRLAWLGHFGLREEGRMKPAIHFGNPTFSCGAQSVLKHSPRCMASCTNLITVRYGPDFGHPFKYLVCSIH